MRLLVKFSAIFALVFCAGVAVIGWLSYGLMQADARAQVLNQAQLMMQAARSVRDYTSLQLKPLLAPDEKRDNVFLPQTVPAYAATENFNYMHASFSDYAYKEASLNPTNPRDRAVDWEADIVNAFRDKPQLQELTGEREASTGPSLFFARPMRAERECMECHEANLAMPRAAMIERYGSSNGFWLAAGKRDCGADCFRCRWRCRSAWRATAFRTLQLIYLSAILLVSLVVLNLVLYFTIARPVARLSDMADRISLGQFDVPELPVRGNEMKSRAWPGRSTACGGAW